MRVRARRGGVRLPPLPPERERERERDFCPGTVTRPHARERERERERERVINDLKQLGGDQRHKGDDLVDIEIESRMQAPPTTPSALSAGAKFGQKLKKKMEEDRRRTLKVGGLTVKLPQPRAGEPARGSLAAKVQRLSSSMASSSRAAPAQEPLQAKLKRMAALFDAGEEELPKMEKRHRSMKGDKGDRPPLRRRRHLSAK